MLIQVNADWRITSDPYNIIVEQRRVAGEKAKVPGEERWESVSFHADLERAAVWLLQKRVKASDVKSIEELAQTVTQACDEIVAAVREVTPDVRR